MYMVSTNEIYEFVLHEESGDEWFIRNLLIAYVNICCKQSLMIVSNDEFIVLRTIE